MRTSGLTEGEKTLFLKEQKEPRSVDFVRRLLQPGMIVVDIGANIGFFTILMAERVGSKGQVHAFEPTPALAERIRLNCRLNGFTNAVVNEVAVSDSIGTASLRISAEDHEANSLFDVDASSDTLSVPTTTLSAYVAALVDEHVDFVKLDCEGSELNALKGAMSVLARSNGPAVMFECNPETLRACGASMGDLIGYLFTVGYGCYKLEQLRGGSEPVWNILAIRPTHEPAARLVAEYQLQPLTNASELL